MKAFKIPEHNSLYKKIKPLCNKETTYSSSRVYLQSVEIILRPLRCNECPLEPSYLEDLNALLRATTLQVEAR